MNQPVLQGQHLSRSFGAGPTLTWALRHASLEMQRGEMVLLMGPSGSGKSTLLAVLSGLLRPTGGQVWALGHDLWQLSERERERFRRRHCGFIFQGYNLFPALPARGQLEIVLRWGARASAREARRQAGNLLERLGLADKMHLRPSALSGGEQQRVAVGRALIKGPDLCFADEPTSALDWSHGEQVVRLLRDASDQRGATVLVVAHDARIIPFVDRVLHIEDGGLQESGVRGQRSEVRSQRLESVVQPPSDL
jgi:putative ABC transport system ATP-binding protein